MNNSPLRLLVMADGEDDAILIVHTLERSGFTVWARRVDTLDGLRAALEEETWDLLTSDHAMPRLNAPAALAVAHTQCPDLPVIIISNEMSPTLAVALLRSGARDHIRKDDLATLPAAVERELCAVRAERQRRQMEAALRESEARWQFALEGAGEGVWDRDAQTGEAFVSQQWKTMLGYDEISTAPGVWEAMIHPDDFARVIAANEDIRTGRTTTLHIEYRIRCKDGRYKWILDRGKVISYTPEGKPLRIIATQADITDRKLAEAELRRLKDFSEGIIQGMLEGIAILDAEGRYIFANPAAYRILGRTPEELLGQPWSMVIPENQQPMMEADHQRRAGLQGQYETDVLRPDGQRVPVFVSSVPRLENGEFSGVVTVFTDLSEHKQVRDRLRASEENFRRVVENAPWGMHFYRLNAAGDLILAGANPAADAILGVPHAELIGQTLESAFPQFAQTEIPRQFRQVAEHGGEWHIEQIGYADGHMTAAYALRAFRIAPRQLVAVIENILERKHAEETIQTQADTLHSQNQELRLQNQELNAQGLAFRRTETELRASEEKYRTLIDTTDTGYVILDTAGRVRDANEEYLRLTGRLELDEILGHPVTEWTAPHDQARNAREVQACLEAGFVRDLEIDYIDAAGQITPVEINATVLPSAEGDVILTLCRDITERRQARNQLKAANASLQAEIVERERAEAQALQLNRDLERRVSERTGQLEAANRELEAFAFSVSHDLRAPLRIIGSYAAVLRQDYAADWPSDAQQCLQVIDKNTVKMERLIGDLLSFARLSRQPMNKEPVEPAGLVREALEELRAGQAGRRVEVALGRLPLCQADPRLLKQVFVNLLSNAFKYTRREEVALIEIGSQSLSGQEVYYVRDNGVGFDMGRAAKLFGVFQRLHSAADFEGAGVGLANVQRIIHRHGGRVWADAEVGQGATFYFTLPPG